MPLIIEAPASYAAERRYIFDVLLSDWLGLDWRLEPRDRSDLQITLDGAADGRVIVPDVLFGTAPDDWLTMASLPAEPLRTGTLDFAEPGPAGSGSSGARRLPVIYGPAASTGSDENLVSFDAAGAQLRVDVFGSAFFMLTRYEEAVRTERGSFDRFPSAASVASRAGFLRTAVVDGYVEVLWAALRKTWPRLQRKERAYQVLVTHDVDNPLATLGRGPALLARQFAADVLRRRDIRVAARRARSLAGLRRGDHSSDPHNTFAFLMDLSERYGLRSAFYFQAHDEIDWSAGAFFPLDHPWVRSLIGDIHNRGHEIGYHAGFGTYLDGARTRKEFEFLRAVAEAQGVRQDHWGGRQHYLQWANPVTWRNWSEAGLSYDCTLAFAETVGFRTGTCHEYQVFDLAERCPLDLRERPFQVMDVTLWHYMSLPPDEATAAVLEIADECRRYAGSLGMLWHNDKLVTAAEKRFYESVLDAVV